MKEPYGEGLASHTGREPCVTGCEPRHEALVAVRTGRVLSREMGLSGVPTLSCKRKATLRAAIWRAVGRPHAVEDPVHVRKHLSRDLGDLVSAPGAVDGGRAVKSYDKRRQ